MKITYMLVNKTGKARKIPPFEAWQWTHYIEDESQLKIFLNGLKKTIRDNRLALANLHVQPAEALESLYRNSSLFYKGPIIYDETLWPKRVINRHEEALESFLDDDDSSSHACATESISLNSMQVKRMASPWGLSYKV